MDRRAAAALVASVVFPGCGGGGLTTSAETTTAGSAAPAAPAPAPTPPEPAEPAVELSPNIAAWGDSLTPPFALNLQILYPARVIYDGGVVGETSTQVAARETADTAGHKTWINVFWCGHNNDNDPARIKADIAACVAALAPGNTRFLVLAVLNKGIPEELAGAPGYATIIALNRDLAATYPENYVDMRAYLVSQYDLTSPQDVTDFYNDVVPSSMRFDHIHMNNRGSVLVARKVKEVIDSKGW